MSDSALLEILRRSAGLTAEQIDFAWRERTQTGARLVQVLVARGLADEVALFEALSRATGMPRVDLRLVPLDPAAARLVPKDWSERTAIVPLRADPRTRTLEVATSDPVALESLAILESQTGLTVIPSLAAESELERLFRHQYAGVPLDRTPISSRFPSPRANSQPSSRPNLPPQKTPPPNLGPQDQAALRALAPLFEQQQESARALAAIFKLCVQRGLISPEEYRARLAATPDEA